MYLKINKFLFEEPSDAVQINRELRDIKTGSIEPFEEAPASRTFVIKTTGLFTCYVLQRKEYNDIIYPEIQRYFNTSKVTIQNDFVRNKNLDFFLDPLGDKYTPPDLNLLLRKEISWRIHNPKIIVDDKPSNLLKQFVQEKEYSCVQNFDSADYIMIDEETYFFICSMFDAVRLARQDLY